MNKNFDFRKTLALKKTDLIPLSDTIFGMTEVENEDELKNAIASDGKEALRMQAIMIIARLLGSSNEHVFSYLSRL